MKIFEKSINFVEFKLNRVILIYGWGGVVNNNILKTFLFDKNICKMNLQKIKEIYFFKYIWKFLL